MTRTSNNFKLFLTPLLTYNFNPILSNCLGNFGPPKYPNIGQHLFTYSHTQTTDTQRRHKSKKSENLGRGGRQNMLRLYLKI